MKNSRDYKQLNRTFVRTNSLLLHLLALTLAVLWFVPFRTVLAPDERLLWQKIRSAEDYMYELRKSERGNTPPEYDPWKTGLIGVEWSSVTTTLGSLESKRTACDPRWSVVAGRWFDKLGLSKGDSIVIYSSGSFPGMLLNILCAAEDRGLDVSMAVSLGASTWGANDPSSLVIPKMGSALRREGFVSTVPSFYTLGGGRELGDGLSPEGIAVLEDAASNAGIGIIRTAGLAEMIDMKTDFLKEKGAKLLVNIGGSSSSMGSDEAVLGLPGGLIMPGRTGGGNGVVARALEMGIPVIHLLNLKELCELTGVPYDSPPGYRISKWKFPLFSIAGIAAFLIIIYRYRRWSRDIR